MVHENRINAGWVRPGACTPHNNCVELRTDPDTVQVRDSKNIDAVPLVFPREKWTAFLVGFVE